MLRGIGETKASGLDAYEPLIDFHLKRLRQMEVGKIALPEKVSGDILSLKDDLGEIRSLIATVMTEGDQLKGKKELDELVSNLTDWIHEKSWEVVTLSSAVRASRG